MSSCGPPNSLASMAPRASAVYERGVDVAARDEDDRAASLGDHLAAEARDAHLEPLEVAGRVEFLPEPSGHLRGHRRARARHEIVGGVRLLPELRPSP
jgi:hypothetical protein